MVEEPWNIHESSGINGGESWALPFGVALVPGEGIGSKDVVSMKSLFKKLVDKVIRLEKIKPRIFCKLVQSSFSRQWLIKSRRWFSHKVSIFFSRRRHNSALSLYNWTASAAALFRSSEKIFWSYLNAKLDRQWTFEHRVFPRQRKVNRKRRRLIHFLPTTTLN